MTTTHHIKGAMMMNSAVEWLNVVKSLNFGLSLVDSVSPNAQLLTSSKLIVTEL